MLEDCTTCGGRFIRARAADNAIVWVHPEPVDGAAIVLAGDPASEPTALWGLAPGEGDELYGVPPGAKRYRRHDCTADGFEEGTREHGHVYRTTREGQP